MRRTWPLMQIAGIFVALGAVHAALAGEKETKDLLDVVEKRLIQMDEGIKESFKTIQSDMRTFETELGQHRTEIDKLTDRIKQLESSSGRPDNIALEAIMLRLDRLEKSLAQGNPPKTPTIAPPAEPRAQLDVPPPSRGIQNQISKKIDLEINDIARKLDDLAAELQDLRRSGLDAVLSRLDRIDQNLSDMKKGRISLYSPSSENGRIVLRNQHNEELFFVVNGRTYRVQAGASQALNAPAGSVNYELISPRWGVRDRKTTTLAANETLTLSAQ
jgi:polyhydroxyalkanoate synthesis regulator phasin